MPVGPAGKDACATARATVCATGGAGLLGELVEEGVVAFVGGPDGEVAGPGDASLGGLPELFGVRVLGEFVEADVAAIDRHGLRMRRKSDDAGAVVEFDVADSNFLSESR